MQMPPPRFSLVSVRMPESSVYIIRNSRSKKVEELHYTPPSTYCRPATVRMSPVPMIAVNLLPIINDIADDEKADGELPLFDDSLFDGTCPMTCECEAVSGWHGELPELGRDFEADDLDEVEAIPSQGAADFDEVQPISSQGAADFDEVQPISSQGAADFDEVQPISSQSTDTSFTLDLD